MTDGQFFTVPLFGILTEQTVTNLILWSKRDCKKEIIVFVIVVNMVPSLLQCTTVPYFCNIWASFLKLCCNLTLCSHFGFTDDHPHTVNYKIFQTSVSHWLSQNMNCFQKILTNPNPLVLKDLLHCLLMMILKTWFRYKVCIRLAISKHPSQNTKL